ncbi:hypothetical protein B9Z55_023557 [Caenorhabditis nigoni]|uniref:Uncharacterized protein n=2 Tax=Caenorhabditis nigoni TaxID=1611254 RepID=A0A2G5SQ99_9PELO|nr:hypothetical protein B9Z55_023557 [Caenorhabditis nigoni]
MGQRPRDIHPDIQNLVNVISNDSLSNITIVVTTQVEPDFVSLVAFLAEKRMEFAVTNDATIPDALNAPRASDEESRMVRGCVKREGPELSAPIKEPEIYRKHLETNHNYQRRGQNRKSRNLKPLFQDVEEETDDLEEQPVTVEQSSSSTKMIELCDMKIIKSNSFHHKAHAAAHLRIKTWKCTLCETIGLEVPLDSQRLDLREEPRWKRMREDRICNHLETLKLPFNCSLDYPRCS